MIKRGSIVRFLEFFLKMELTWEDFLGLAAIITNLYNTIGSFQSVKIDIKEKHRRVEAAARNYQELFKESKYVNFMKKVRIS